MILGALGTPDLLGDLEDGVVAQPACLLYRFGHLRELAVDDRAIPGEEVVRKMELIDAPPLPGRPRLVGRCRRRGGVALQDRNLMTVLGQQDGRAETHHSGAYYDDFGHATTPLRSPYNGTYMSASDSRKSAAGQHADGHASRGDKILLLVLTGPIPTSQVHHRRARAAPT